MTSKKLTRKASRSLKIVANAMRKMQIPAYCPAVPGVKCDDQRGVLVDVKNTIAIESIPIIVVMSEDELAEEVAMDIPDIVSVADAVADIDIELISILAICYECSVLPESIEVVAVS